MLLLNNKSLKQTKYYHKAYKIKIMKQLRNQSLLENDAQENRKPLLNNKSLKQIKYYHKVHKIKIVKQPRTFHIQQNRMLLLNNKSLKQTKYYHKVHKIKIMKQFRNQSIIENDAQENRTPLLKKVLKQIEVVNDWCQINHSFSKQEKFIFRIKFHTSKIILLSD